MRRNESLHRGGALKIERGTKASVGYCDFYENYSEQQGGGIYNAGEAHIFLSTFHHNEAHVSPMNI